MNLHPLAAGVWSMSETKKMIPGVSIPAAGLVVKLANSEIVLVSPSPSVETISSQIDALGKVTTIVSTSRNHTIGFTKAAQHYPGARALAGQVVVDKVKDEVPRVELLTDATQTNWGDELVHLHVAGMPKLDETIVFHRASGVMYISDLLFNLKTPENFFGRLMMSVISGPPGPRCPKMIQREIKDPGATRASIDQLIAMHPTQLFLSHGAAVNADAEGTLRRAFEQVHA